MANDYTPDSVSPPGETLREALLAMGMKHSELADRIGKNKVEITDIIRGRRPITPDTALQLERALGIPANFWLTREQQYREAAARLSEHQRLGKHIGWLKTIPVKSMVQLGWLPKRTDRIDQLRDVLNFFGVASPEQWRQMWDASTVTFRAARSFRKDAGAVSAWLRMGYVCARQIKCSPFDRTKFKRVLLDARTWTKDSPEAFQPKLKSACAEAGVAVVFVPELPGIRTSAATRWLPDDRALVQLCLRYKTDDQLWFSFFHEAGHILLHGRREVFIEDGDTSGDKEAEADHFASEFLIPSKEYRRLDGHRFFSKDLIQEFAKSIGIAPGIVVGRLQHDERLHPSHCNGLKRKLAWRLRQPEDAKGTPSCNPPA